MPTIFVDECGYTGADLANAAQPIFSVATHSFSEADCADLVQRHFAAVKAKELKHSSLARRPAQQAMVLSFLAEIGSRREDIKCGAMNKLFCLATKVVDLIIEPMAHEDGIDLYEGGLHLALSNVLYFSLLRHGGRAALVSYLSAFQAMARERTAASLQAFAGVHKKASRSGLPKQLSVPILGAIARYGPRLLEQFEDANALDLPFTTCVTLFGSWRSSVTGPITVVHDESSYMAKRLDLWEFIVSKDRNRFERRVADLTVSFPIGIEETVFTGSAGSKALQVADVIAGSVCVAAAMEGDYGDRIRSAIGDWDLSARIFPETDLEGIRARMSGRTGTEMIEYLMRERAGSRRGSSSS